MAPLQQRRPQAYSHVRGSGPSEPVSPLLSLRRYSTSLPPSRMAYFYLPTLKGSMRNLYVILIFTLTLTLTLPNTHTHPTRIHTFAISLPPLLTLPRHPGPSFDYLAGVKARANVPQLVDAEAS